MVPLIKFFSFSKIVTQTYAKMTGFDLLMNQTSLVVQNFGITKRNYRKIKGVPRFLPWSQKNIPDYQTEILNSTLAEKKLETEVCKDINSQIAENKTGRLFAYVHLAGKQYKVTESDLIVVRGYWPPQPDDKIVLEKVLLVGNKNFTLLGKPILNRELITIDATVIGKTFSHTITHFRFRKRKQYRRIHFYRIPLTMIRINSITLKGKVDQKLEVEGLDRVY